MYLLATLIISEVLGLGSAPVWGDSNSENIVRQGLAVYRQEKWEEAFQLFDNATRVDPQDPLALYYRGLSSARRGLWDAALNDMERAAEIRSDLPGLSLDLGVANYEVQRFEDAERWLMKSYDVATERSAAAFFRGLVHYRTGDDTGAQGFLEEAEQDRRFHSSAAYYRALSLLRQGETKQARELLEQVKNDNPESEVGQVAANYLTRVFESSRVAPAVEGNSGREWQVHALAGFEYDSNVVLAPDDENVQLTRGIGDEGDGRARIGLGGRYRFFNNETLFIAGSYELHQSIHFKLREFDLQAHRLRIDIASQPGDLLQFGMTGMYDFNLLDYSSYYQQGAGSPWLTIFEGDSAATQFQYTLRGRDYLDDPFDPYLDSINHAVGIRQFVSLGDPERVLSAGYQIDVDDPVSDDGEEFAYLGHEIDLLVESPLGDFAFGRLGYAFRYQDYANANSRSPTGDSREDTRHRFTVGLQRALTPQWIVDLAYIGALNDSNLEEFQYNRHILSAMVRFIF